MYIHACMHACTCMLTRYHEKVLCHRQNVRVKLPHPLLERRGSVIRNNFLEYTTKQATLLARRNDFMHCLLQIKQIIYSIGIFRAPVVTQFVVKV